MSDIRTNAAMEELIRQRLTAETRCVHLAMDLADALKTIEDLKKGGIGGRSDIPDAESEPDNTE